MCVTAQPGWPRQVMPEMGLYEMELQLTCFASHYRMPQRSWLCLGSFFPQRLPGGPKTSKGTEHLKSGFSFAPKEGATQRAEPHYRNSTPLLVSNG